MWIFRLFVSCRDSVHGRHGFHGVTRKRPLKIRVFRVIRVQKVLITPIPNEPIFLFLQRDRKSGNERDQPCAH